MRVWLFLALGVAAVAAWGQQISFVACPIVRDTKTVPCFLAEYNGETYFLETPNDHVGGPTPQLQHQVLVEGTVDNGPRVCGGIRLKSVSVSVLKEIDSACNTLLPAEPGIEAPGGWMGTLMIGVQREYTLKFQFGDSALDPSSVWWFSSIHGSSAKVMGYRATSLLSNGQRMVEKEGIAKERAENVAALLRGLGVKNVTADWKSEAEPGDGENDAARRRVVITITP